MFIGTLRVPCTLPAPERGSDRETPYKRSREMEPATLDGKSVTGEETHIHRGLGGGNELPRIRTRWKEPWGWGGGGGGGGGGVISRSFVSTPRNPNF